MVAPSSSDRLLQLLQRPKAHQLVPGFIPQVQPQGLEAAAQGQRSDGLQIRDLTVDAVRESVAGLSRMPTRALAEMAMRAWAYARENHTHQRFSEDYRRAVEQAVESAGGKGRTAT